MSHSDGGSCGGTLKLCAAVQASHTPATRPAHPCAPDDDVCAGHHQRLIEQVYSRRQVHHPAACVAVGGGDGGLQRRRQGGQQQTGRPGVSVAAARQQLSQPSAGSYLQGCSVISGIVAFGIERRVLHIVSHAG